MRFCPFGPRLTVLFADGPSLVLAHCPRLHHWLCGHWFDVVVLPVHVAAKSSWRRPSFRAIFAEHEGARFRVRITGAGPQSLMLCDAERHGWASILSSSTPPFFFCLFCSLVSLRALSTPSAIWGPKRRQTAIEAFARPRVARQQTGLPWFLYHLHVNSES